MYGALFLGAKIGATTDGANDDIQPCMYVWCMVFGVLVLVFAAAAVVAAVECAARGRLGPNNLVGIRAASVMASDEAWQRGHQAARPCVWIGALLAVTGGSLSLVVDPTHSNAFVLAGLSAFLIFVLLGSAIAVRAARQVPPPGVDDDRRETPLP
ncbi:hypothetical protein C5D34_11970 [Rathayibacter sp. AY1B1]|nr:hypothetical protein C5D08_01275 [Rathayibacter sp. AY1B6]PPI32009.1 hypothetical protein C5D34_11970 [Rathayibacter sp. AY1B1]